MTDEQAAIVVAILSGLAVICAYFYVIERGDDQ